MFYEPEDLVIQIGVLDIEKSQLPGINPEPWQTDTSIGPWGYDVRRPYRPTVEIVHELVDIVSKNGNLLLNVPPKADGTLDESEFEIQCDDGPCSSLTSVVPAASGTLVIVEIVK